jgi:hypothetical protein
MNAEKQDTSREIVQSDEIGVEMEMEVEMEAAVDSTAKAMEPVAKMEADSTAKSMEEILVREDTDPVKVEMDLRTEVFWKWSQQFAMTRGSTALDSEDSITEANMIIKLRDKNEVQARKKGIVQLNGNGTYAVIDHLGNNGIAGCVAPH